MFIKIDLSVTGLRGGSSGAVNDDDQNSPF